MATGQTAAARGVLSSLTPVGRSSIGEEIGGLGLVPAPTMRANAAERLLPVTSQAIRKHLRDRGAGAGAPAEFMPKQNFALANPWLDGRTERRIPRLAMSKSAATRGVKTRFTSARY
jgi:hypothetical protein